MFKAQGGPTYAGCTGWKRFTDFLISKMPEVGAVDLDFVENPSGEDQQECLHAGAVF